MIAKLKIEEGRFKSGYIRRGEGELKINDFAVEWPQKWQVTLRPDAILATSIRIKGGGGNVISFEVTLNGVSRLCLKTTKGTRKLINMNQVFVTQRNLDGELYLVYNGNGYRTAYFFSEEYLRWKEQYDILSVANKNPNEITFRDRRINANSSVAHDDGFAIYVSGRLTTITDGEILFEKRTDSRLGVEAQYVRISDASWVILEKARKNRIERTIITKQPVFELRLPNTKLSQIRKCSEYGLELYGQASPQNKCCG